VSGEQLALWWVGRYTRGLAPDVRDERRAELASDLWEHRATGGDGLATELAIASRCLRGVPADLSWRRSRRHGRRSLPGRRTVLRGAGWALAGTAYAMLVLGHAWLATPALGLDLWGADQAPADVTYWSRISLALLGALVGGAASLRRAPRIGASLVGGASVATAGLMWWFLPVLGPTAVAVTTGVAVLARRRRRAFAGIEDSGERR
jgi:hypothetical protein